MLQPMKHIILFCYIILITAGFGGITALVLLYQRLKDQITGFLILVDAALVLTLFINILHYYLDILPLDVPQVIVFLQFLSFVCGLVMYGGITLVMRKLPEGPKRWGTVIGCTPLIAMSLQMVFVLTGNSALAKAFSGPYIVVVSSALAAIGYILFSFSSGVKEESLQWLLKQLGFLTMVYAAISTLYYLLSGLSISLSALEVTFEYIFQAGWSFIAVSAFIRHLSRPPALIGEDALSRGFLTTFGITPREAEVIKLISLGLSNQDIADNLGVSFTTVRTHVYNIFRKVGVGNRVELLSIISGYRE